MVSDAFGRLESFWQAIGGSFLGGWLVVENASKLFFSRDPERPFDIERPRNWGSFGAELNGLKPWRRGGFRCFWEAGKLLAGCWWKLFGRLVIGRLVSGGKC